MARFSAFPRITPLVVKGFGLPKPHSVHLKAEVQGPLAAVELEENRTISAAARARAPRGLRTAIMVSNRASVPAMQTELSVLAPEAVGLSGRTIA